MANNNLKPFDKNSRLHDYQHARRIFVDDNYRLSPKYGFLFHVAFDINIQFAYVSANQAMEAGMLVKSVNLPKFTVDTKTLNSYNRPNVIQNKIKYDPIQITFHDDNDDTLREFWYDYYHYYYRDSDHLAESTYHQPSKYNLRMSKAWGYTPRGQALSILPDSGDTNQYITAIRIYSLHQKKFSEYTLINPFITNFSHGEHANGSNETVTSTMTIAYESVKYATGYVSDFTVEGFADLHYDHTPSDLGKDTAPDTIIHDYADKSFFNSVTRGLSKGQGVGQILGGLLQPSLAGILGSVLGGSGSTLGGFTIPGLSGLAGTGTGIAGSIAGSLGGFGQGTSIGSAVGGIFSSNGQAIGDQPGDYPLPGEYNPELPPDASSVYTYTDPATGETTEYLEDGSKVYTSADGSVNYEPADPFAETTSYNTDGSITTRYQDGGETITYPDGGANFTPGDQTNPVDYESDSYVWDKPNLNTAEDTGPYDAGTSEFVEVDF